LTRAGRARLDAVLALARCLEPLADDGRGWDADPWLLGTPTGVVNLKTGEHRNGRPDDRILLQAGVGFDPDARCPRWEQAIHEWFPDSELADFVWMALGYSITGITTEQVLFAAHNGGAGGTSTMLGAVRHVLGNYAYDMPFSAIELQQRAAIPNDLAALDGRRFILASETNDGTRLNEARVKSLTGGDACTARFLHGEFFTFQPVGKLWLAFNHKPIVRDDSFGFWRRVRLIPFVKTFQPDPTLAMMLRAEAEGILTWLVRGCLEWQERGLCAPPVVSDATAEYRADSDHFGRFLSEATDTDGDSVVSATDLYAHYQTWADQHSYGPRERLTVTGFGRKAGERLRRIRSRTGMVYVGIARRDAM
jgi:putative DNA primase/helicase